MSLAMFAMLLAIYVFGYLVGQYFERRHLASLVARERRTKHIKLMTSKNIPSCLSLASVERGREDNQINETGLQLNAKLVMGTCVLSVSYFKQLEIMLRQLFGGRIRTYEGLVDRARREAILRLKAQCRNAEHVVNLRVETAAIAQGKQDSRCVEVLAYATAIYRTASLTPKDGARVWP